MKKIQLLVDAAYSAIVLATGLRSLLATTVVDPLEFDIDVVAPDWERNETNS